MFVRCKKRFKDGKEHGCWSVVGNCRVSGGRVVQRQVLYLGEISDSQRAAVRPVRPNHGLARPNRSANLFATALRPQSRGRRAVPTFGGRIHEYQWVRDLKTRELRKSG